MMDLGDKIKMMGLGEKMEMMVKNLTVEEFVLLEASRERLMRRRADSELPPAEFQAVLQEIVACDKIVRSALKRAKDGKR